MIDKDKSIDIKKSDPGKPRSPWHLAGQGKTEAENH